MLGACGDRQVLSRIAWSNAPVGADFSTRAVSGDSFLTPRYANYGTLVATLTPTTFRLPLNAVELANAASYFAPIPFHHFDQDSEEWIVQYGEFGASVTRSADGEVAPGIYTGFTVFFHSEPGEGEFSSTPGIYADFEPQVIVNLPPGYESYLSADVPYVSSYTGTTQTTNGQVLYHAKIVDAAEGIFQFSLNRLFPRDLDGSWNTMDIFCFTGDDYVVYAPGVDGVPDVFDILDYKDTPGMSVSGNMTFTVAPWDGLAVSPDARVVEFVFTWDLDNIVELYDHDTPGHVSDDILVIADKFWERMSMQAVQYDASGNRLE